MGKYLLEELHKLAQRHKVIGNVRGQGLMLGVELVKNQETKEPGTQEANQIMELSRQRGLLMGKGGAFGNVIRFQPSLCYSMEDAKYTVEALDDAFHNLKL